MKYFSIIIGSNGFLFKFNKNREVLKELFINGNIEDNVKELTAFFKQSKTASIYIFLDNLSQNYNRKQFPYINFFDLKKIVNRKFNVEIPSTDLKAKFFIEKNKEKKICEFLFVSAGTEGKLSDVINFVQNLPNLVYGIYMVPLETENLLPIIFNKLRVKKKNRPKLVILVLENKVGGLRQISFKNGKILFTRFICDDNEEMHTDFKSKLTFYEEDTKKTISFIKRFTSDVNYNDLMIITITNNDIKNIFEKMKLGNINKMNYTPTEFSKLLNGNKSKKEYEFCDDVIEKQIMFSKKVHTFVVGSIHKVKMLCNLVSFLKFVLFVCFITCLYFSIVLGYVILSYKNNINNLRKRLKNITTTFEEKKKNDPLTQEKRPYFVMETAKLFTFYNYNYRNPFILIDKVGNIFEKHTVDIKRYSWILNGFNYSNFKNNSALKYNVVVNFDLINKDGLLDNLLNKYDNLKKSFNDIGPNMKGRVSELNKTNLNFSEKYYIYNSTLNIDEVK